MKRGFSILHICVTLANSLKVAAKLEIKIAIASLTLVLYVIYAFEVYSRFLTHLWGSLALTMI